MARNVNIQISSFTDLGTQVPVDQYSVDLVIDWTKNDGSPGSKTQTVIFPNILNDPAISNAWLKRNLTELLLAALREIEGVDTG